MNVSLCECGCRTAAFPNQLNPVRVDYHSYDNGVEKVISGRTWQVLPEHAADFRRELEMMNAQHTFCDLLGEQPWWRRLPHAHDLYDAQVAILKRIKGLKRARLLARRFVCVVIAPDWLADRLTERWARQQRAQPVPPIQVRERPSTPQKAIS